MKQRLNPFKSVPELMQAMLALSEKIEGAGLDRTLAELVKTRASQINGCAYCIHMHTRDARANGETEERLLLLDAWRESPLYSDRERAALAWAEALTSIAQTHAPDAVFADASRHFSEAELARLTLIVANINAWNRIAMGLRFVHPTGAARARPAA
ncbi:MAG: carboxymuconolactone decarboxylase family protein [Geminicoccaceae bacterium]